MGTLARVSQKPTDDGYLCCALSAVMARGALGAGQNLFQAFNASCFGFGGSSTAFTVIASIA